MCVSLFPYDSKEEGVPNLRTESAIVRNMIINRLQERVSKAGA
jgi:hypothetical protein